MKERYGIPGNILPFIKAPIEDILGINAGVCHGLTGFGGIEVDGADVFGADGDLFAKLLPDLPQIHAVGGGHRSFRRDAQALEGVAELHFRCA